MTRATAAAPPRTGPQRALGVRAVLAECFERVRCSGERTTFIEGDRPPGESHYWPRFGRRELTLPSCRQGLLVPLFGFVGDDRDSALRRVELIAQPFRLLTFNAMNENKILTLTLSIPAPLTTHLWSNASPSCISEQPDRFWTYDYPELPDPHSPVFRDGTMMWTESMSDALILRACEQQLGHVTTLLFDEACCSAGPVILTSRPYAAWEEGRIR